jgi:hypothetical protein
VILRHRIHLYKIMPSHLGYPLPEYMILLLLELPLSKAISIPYISSQHLS